MIASSVHDAIEAVDLRVREKRGHSKRVVLMGHLHCPTHKHEDNEHAVDLTLVDVCVLMTVS